MFETALKGFIVPMGYILTVHGQQKYPGEYSGSHYTFEEVASGAVPEWSLEQVAVSPPENTELQSIMTGIHLVGGEALFVGGIVRDRLSGRESKDIDIEVYGVQPEELEQLLSSFGKVDTVGASFGIIKLTTEDADYDFSLPRRESKDGSGHRGFIVESDPNMTPEEAASRRDFTINSLAMRHDGTLLDFFGGLKDLKNGVLRHTSPKFSEDSLRVLRGFQFAARFNLKMDKITASLCSGLRNEYKDLPKERIWGEWEKWAVKGKVPSAGLQVLEDTNWLELYPELFNLVLTQQDPEHHPEGGVFSHTKYVCDEAAAIADRENLDDRDRMILMFAALCHDLGKPATTVFENGRWKSPAHAQEGERPTITFLASIGAPLWLIEQVVPLVKEHMAHVGVEKMTDRVVRRIANRVYPSNIQMLAYVIEADHSGRPPLRKELPEQAREMLEISERLNVMSDKPVQIIGGKDLFLLAEEGALPEAYLKPGRHFGVLLKYLYEAQLDGKFTTPKEGRLFIKELFDDEERERIETNIDFILNLSYMKTQMLIAEFGDMTEQELVRLPLDDLKRAALVS